MASVYLLYEFQCFFLAYATVSQGMNERKIGAFPVALRTARWVTSVALVDHIGTFFGQGADVSVLLQLCIRSRDGIGIDRKLPCRLSDRG